MRRRAPEGRGRGQALVEFALVVPLFLLVVLGLFDMGRAVFYYSTISNAAREAVRLGIVDQNTSKIQQEAVDVASAVMTVQVADVAVAYLNPDLSTGGACATTPYQLGCIVRVRITHQFTPATPFVPSLTISSETHQPIERRYVSP